MRLSRRSYHDLIARAIPWLASALVGLALVSPDGGQPVALLLFLLLLPLLLAGYWRPVSVSREWLLTLLLPLATAIPLFIGSGTGEALDGPSRYFVAALVLLALMHLPLDHRYLLRAASLGGIAAIVWNFSSLGDPRVNWGPGYLDSGYIGVLMLSLSLAQFHIDRGDRKWRLVAIVGTVCLVVAVMKTGTRGAWPAMMLVFALQFVLVDIPRRLKLMMALGVIGVLGAATWLVPTVRDRIELTAFEVVSYYQENNRASSVGYRLDFWDIALTCFRESPLWGVSYPRRGEIMEAYIEEHPASASMGVDGRSSSHNEIMDALAKRGLLGVLSILLLYLVPLGFFVNVVRNARDPTVAHLGIAGGGLVLTMILCGMTEAPVMNVRVGTTYAFLLIFLYRVLAPPRSHRSAGAFPGDSEAEAQGHSPQVAGDPGGPGSIHLVRRFGPVGGMERYVWELTNALAAKGHPVRILCEQHHLPGGEDQLNPAIEIVALGASRIRKPRWLGLMDFDRRATAWLNGNDVGGWVIHSHERSRQHHATTFHGPSIHSRQKGPADVFSLRLWAWEWLERREVAGPRVQVVYPVSDQIGETLRSLYPGCRDRIADPAYPGVHPRFAPQRRDPAGKVIGFIGVEWERKGLDLLATAVHQLRQTDPEITLCVAGCAPHAVKHLFAGWEDGVELLGWIDPLTFYQRINLLVLPARNEPYGMVVAEANATGLPVVVSDHCGISSLIDSKRGAVVSLGDNKALETACRRMLVQRELPPAMGLSWAALADRHAADYRRIDAQITGEILPLAGVASSR